jgi:hypothetical protein
MREVDVDDLGPGRGAKRGDSPPAPYHGVARPEGGLTPPEDGGEAALPQRATRAAAGDVGRDAEHKLSEERADHEGEAANAPRGSPDAGRRG